MPRFRSNPGKKVMLRAHIVVFDSDGMFETTDPDIVAKMLKAEGVVLEEESGVQGNGQEEEVEAEAVALLADDITTAPPTVAPISTPAPTRRRVVKVHKG